jgi:hypothetical protein
MNRFIATQGFAEREPARDNCLALKAFAWLMPSAQRALNNITLFSFD